MLQHLAVNQIFHCFVSVCTALSLQYVMSCFVIHNVHMSNQAWLRDWTSWMQLEMEWTTPNRVISPDACVSYGLAIVSYFFCPRLCHVIAPAVRDDSKSPTQYELSKGRMIRFRPIQLPGARQLTQTHTHTHTHTHTFTLQWWWYPSPGNTVNTNIYQEHFVHLCLC